MINKYDNFSGCFTNRVTAEALRATHLWTLNDLAQCVFSSAGPNGSTTQILKPSVTSNGTIYAMNTMYTKDGKTIVAAQEYNGAIESSIKEEIVKACDAVDDEVGDGTTSITVLAALLYNALTQVESNRIPPYMIIRVLNDVVDRAKKLIKTKAEPLTLGEVYDISMISTNSNEEMSSIISSIYGDFGYGSYIDVRVSNDQQHHIVDYRGLTLNVGCADTAYINQIKKNGDASNINEKATANLEDVQGSSIINNAEIYAFVDPIDTIEMAGYLNEIIFTNIMDPFNNIINARQSPSSYSDVSLYIETQYKKMVPTVILAPKISLDMENSFNKVVTLFHSLPLNERPPLLVVTNIDNFLTETYVDIFTLCGCKPIKKYIDPKLQEMDTKQGLTFSAADFKNYAGHCDEVKSDMNKTIFINPDKMFEKYETDTTLKDGTIVKAGTIKTDNNGNLIKGNQYTVLCNAIEAELTKAISSSQDYDTIGNLRRRLNSLKGTLIELYIGGATDTDRESVRDLVVDAVKNIRSAATHGVGYGCNFEGLRALNTLMEEECDDELQASIINVLYDAYREFIKMLYQTMYIPQSKINDLEVPNGMDIYEFMVDKCLENDMPLNIVSQEWDGLVRCSIQQDIAIMDTIARIIGMMFTTNQALTGAAYNNIYNKPVSTNLQVTVMED